MSAALIQFPTPAPREGNGSLEVVRDYFESTAEADHFLANLWVSGFKVVPLEDSDLGD